MARSWGFWTKGKLDILRDYLNAFTTATKNKASERIYLDLFAGEPDNIDRGSGQPIEGSPMIAASVSDPPFTRLRFFELPPRARELERRLKAEYPDQDLRVYEGDCNETIHRALADLEHLAWAPTFAFIDPNGPHYEWTTLEALASFKVAGRSKTELWMLFPDPMFVRFLRIDGGEVDPEHAQLISQMYGTEDWRFIYEARLENHLTPAQARAEYVNLMRWRLQTDLGYRWTHTLQVHNVQGRPIYHLIFATDHVAGDSIMRSLYTRALVDFPRMRQHAIDQQKGTLRLFDDADFAEDADEYRYEPPWPPYGSE